MFFGPFLVHHKTYDMKKNFLRLFPAALLIFLAVSTSSFTRPVKQNLNTLNVLANPGLGPVQVDVTIQNADPTLPVHFTLSYNDGQRVETYTHECSCSDTQFSMQAPIVVGFVDVVAFWQ
jgi:hypothetical protein